MSFRVTIGGDALTKALGDDCGFERKASLYLATKKSQVAKLRQEYETRKRFGLRVDYLDANRTCVRR